MPRTVILLLAAGSSSRLGRSKQMLLLPTGQSLLQHSLQAAIDSQVSEVVLVLGANYNTHLKHIKSFRSRIHLVENPNWSSGMGSSIKRGLEYLQDQLIDWDSLIISVCDQPYLDVHVFDALIHAAKSSSKSIIASRYDDQNYGVPVLFAKLWMDALLQISDASGALSLLKQNPYELETIPFSKGAIDIDTPQDWEDFQ